MNYLYAQKKRFLYINYIKQFQLLLLIIVSFWQVSFRTTKRDYPVSRKKTSTSGNVELMHECLPKHLLMQQQ